MNRVQRVHVEVFLGHIPRRVRAVQAAGHEEGLLGLREMLDAPGHAPGIYQRALGSFLVERFLRLAFGEHAVAEGPWAPIGRVHRQRVIRVEDHLVPVLRAVIAIVVDLARAQRSVTELPHVIIDAEPAADVRHPDLLIMVDAGGGRTHAAHEGRARRVAERGGALRVAEGHAPRGHLVQVRRLGLRVAGHGADPVVQVVRNNEQDVRLLVGGGRGLCARRPEHDCGSGQHGAKGLAVSILVGFARMIHI